MVKATQDQIKILIKLQDIDTKKAKIVSCLEDTPAKLAELNEKLEDFEGRIDEKKSIISEMKKKYKMDESDIQMNLSKIKSKNERLSSIKTNKEYQAMLKEISGLKRQNSLLEDQMLESLDLLETKERIINEGNEEFQAVKKEITDEKNAVMEEKEKDAKDLASLEKDWKSIAAQAPSDLIDCYKTIKQGSKGQALVPAKDAICQGCYMNIPPQMYNELQRCDTLTFCPHCHRILYWMG